jgi:hypothetical protein
MKSKETPPDKGASSSRRNVEAHLDQLSPAEQAEKMHAFHEVVAEIGAHRRIVLQP